MTRRHRKVQPRERKKKAYELHEHFHGQRATFLHVQCLQYILRAQLRALIEGHGIDERAEAVGRDLWLMLLASQEHQDSIVPDAPGDYARGDEPPTAFVGVKRLSKPSKRKRKASTGKSDQGDQGDNESDAASPPPPQAAHEGSTSSPSASSSDDDWTRQQASDSDQDEMMGSGSEPVKRRQRRAHSKGATQATPKTKTERGDPRSKLRMESTLLVCYLACLTLRQPITLGEIVRLAAARDLVYLDAFLHLPREMVEHAGHEVRDALNKRMAVSLSFDWDWKWLLRKLVRMYADDWNVTFPEPNAPLIASAYIERLALPAECYTGAKRLLAILPPLSLTVAFAKRWDEKVDSQMASINLTDQEHERLKASGDRIKTMGVRSPIFQTLPELLILACVLLSFKLLWLPAL